MGLSGSEQLGLRYAGRVALGFLVVIVLLTAPPIPFGILRNQETGGIMAGSPFMSGLIVLISLLFLVVGTPMAGAAAPSRTRPPRSGSS